MMSPVKHHIIIWDFVCRDLFCLSGFIPTVPMMVTIVMMMVTMVVTMVMMMTMMMVTMVMMVKMIVF